MAKKPRAKTDTDEAAEAEAAPRSSRKMLLASALMCLVSLAVGVFLARSAYLEDAEKYDAHSVEDEGKSEDAKDDKGHGEKEAKLRTDITDPLAKDGHEAESAAALQDKSGKEKGEKGKDGDPDGVLDFGEILTNIETATEEGRRRSYLKVNLMVVYRTDEGASEVLKKRKPFMRDLFNGYLRGLSEDDVRGMGGILMVKAELLKRARAAAGSDLPQEVLINDLILQ